MRKIHAEADVLKSVANFAPPADATSQVIEEFLLSLDTALGRLAWSLYETGDHDALLDLDIDPNSYDDADLFHRDYLAICFLSKADFLKTSHDKKAKAIAKFLKFEEQCKQTNQRFKNWSKIQTSDYAHLLSGMREKIHGVLGEFDVEEFFEKTGWGPGVSTLVKGEDCSASIKYLVERGITSDLYSLVLPAARQAYPRWLGEERLGDSDLIIEVGNTVTSVPKNSKIDRIIAIEPGLNLFFQKSIGKMIRKRLRARGVDLRFQERNQQLARCGSLTGTLATVDFSSASDSIAYHLVEYLLPARWFTVLNACRSKNGTITQGGETTTFSWEKFSSMGNGFTFELESLIFWAAAKAVCKDAEVASQQVSVYGDDVIIPSAVYQAYADFCVYLGFTVNLEKSFSSGSFRESCGAHWFAGSDVKPLYLKESLTHVSCFYKLANSIRRLAHRRSSSYGCDRRLLPVWRALYSGTPKPLRLMIPEGYGDCGFVSNFDEATPVCRRSNGTFTGFEFPALREKGLSTTHYRDGHMFAKLREIRGPQHSFISYAPPPLMGLASYDDAVFRRLCLFTRLGFHSGKVETEDVEVQCFDQEVSDSSEQNNDSVLRNRTEFVKQIHSVQSWYNFGSWD